MKNDCIFETIEDSFNFGKYRGLTLADVLDIDSSYIVWCEYYCDGVHFLIKEKALEQIKIAFPEFNCSDDFIRHCSFREYCYWEDVKNDPDEPWEEL